MKQKANITRHRYHHLEKKSSDIIPINNSNEEKGKENNIINININTKKINKYLLKIFYFILNKFIINKYFILSLIFILNKIKNGINTKS